MKRRKTNSPRKAQRPALTERIPVRRLVLLGLCACVLGAGVFLVSGAIPRVRAAVRGHSFPATTNRQAAEAIWQDVVPESLAAQGQRQMLPATYRTLRLDRAGFAALLAQAPLEFSAAARNASVIITLPRPDGTLARFRVEESPIFEPALAARFPTLKTYRGQGVDDPTASARFDWTPEGLHAIILSTRGTSYVEPYSRDDNATYLAYAHSDLPAESGILDCQVEEEKQAQALKRLGTSTSRSSAPQVTTGGTLRIYRLAVAATAEYTQTYGGGTVTGALSAITTTINLVNAIYERDLSIRLQLISGEDSIIFTDAATDGYTSDNVGTLIGENQTKLDNVIGSANYDIGHVFDGRLSGGGFSFQGQAAIGSVCRTTKGRGVSILRSVQPSAVIAYYIVAHEMGHQFSATHTFNAAPSGTDCAVQRTAATAYEPGTGTTIMGYRFNCGSEDFRSTDTYFHIASLEQIASYTTSSSGATCAALAQTTNNPPSVSAGANYTIPANTPFTLTATGTDTDGDALTYTWEEFDVGPAAPPDTDDGFRPIFRSFAPTATPARTFPRLADILANTQTFGESLPTTTRTMNFRVTARDNRTGSGGVNSSAMQVNVRADSGPFTVSAPAGGTSWAANSLQTVTWNVANTANAPVSCASVRILLSTDGGQTYPFLLANGTPNDGAETVVMPNVASQTARIKVEAVGNVFFDISDANFSVTDNPCNFSLSATSASFDANGGAGSVNVTTTGGCAWAAISNADWITINAGAQTSGSGTVSYTVSPNSNGARTGTLIIAGQTYTIFQSSGCTYSVSGQSSFSAGGGPGALPMTTGPGCNWRATSLVPWITITAGASGTGSGTININVAPNPGPARSGQILHTDDSFFTITQAAADTVTLKFGTPTYTAPESTRDVAIEVTRMGDTTGPASVDFMTVDDPAAVPCDPNARDGGGNPFPHGTAYARCDYATTLDTISFAAGETQKTIAIPLIDDVHIEGNETVQLRLLNPVGGVLGSQTTATLTITDNDTGPATNPIFANAFFVRQQYLDFLSREPEQSGFDAWLRVLDGCPDVNNVDPNSPSAGCDRITVSAAFFGSQEFQLKGTFVYRFYKVAFGRLPAYDEFTPDLRQVTGQTAAEVFAKKAAYANAFAQRQEFTNAYGQRTNAEYVTTLLGRYQLSAITTPDPANPDGTQKVTLTRDDLINRLNGTQQPVMTRAQVLRAIADSNEVAAAEFNRAFVAMQYYSYLRRTPEDAGYNAWLAVLQRGESFRTMVNGFMNSTEYRLRFGQP